MKRFLLLALLVVAFPVTASTQSYYRQYYVQKQLPEVQKKAYFLENRTGSPLKVVLLVELPNGGRQWWPFEIEPDKEVYAMLPLGKVRARVDSAVAMVPKGDKIMSEKVGSYVYDREDEKGRVQRGWFFFRK